MQKLDDQLNGSYQSCTSRTHVKQYNRKNQSLANPQHFYTKTEQDTETPRQKTLNNTLVTTNKG